MADYRFAAPKSYHGLFRHYQSYYERLLAIIADATELKPSYILDLACGTGEFTNALSRRFSKSKVLGLDISSQFIDFAKANKANLEIEFYVAPADTLPGLPWARNVDTIFIKGAYHLFETALPLEVFTKPQFQNLRCIVVIEKLQRSLESYPVPKTATMNRRKYVSNDLSMRRLSVPPGVSNTSISFGQVIAIPAEDYFEAVRQRQFSYLHSVEDVEMDSWLREHSSDQVIRIFEENVCNIYHM